MCQRRQKSCTDSAIRLVEILRELIAEQIGDADGDVG
jgi:hypothetical protein